MHTQHKIALNTLGNCKLKVITVIGTLTLYPLEVHALNQFNRTAYYLGLPSVRALNQSIIGNTLVPIGPVPEIIDTPYRNTDRFPHALHAGRLNHIRVGKRSLSEILHIEVLHPAVCDVIARVAYDNVIRVISIGQKVAVLYQVTSKSKPVGHPPSLRVSAINLQIGSAER